MTLTSDRPSHVVVIGAGVVGLTSAIKLRQAGLQVTIVAENFQNIASNVACALWEWPPNVYDLHRLHSSNLPSTHLSMISYDRFKQLQAEYGEEQSGVSLRDIFYYFPKPIDRFPSDLSKMNQLKNNVDGFARGIGIIPQEIDPKFVQNHVKDCYKHITPMIDIEKYLSWLQQQAKDTGCILIQQRIEDHLILDEKKLCQRYKAHAIVACAGLGTIGLLGDTQMYPVRGTIVRMKQSTRVVNAAHCIMREQGLSNTYKNLFIVPRGEHGIDLGGLAQPNHWDCDLSLQDPFVAQMYKGCLEAIPTLEKCQLDPIKSVDTNYCPFTSKKMILDRIPGTNIILNYGHGGAGVTLSWGCAEQVVKLVQDAVQSRSHIDSITKKINSNCPTTFILQDGLSFRAQLERVKFMNHNIVLICSRSGLSKIPVGEFCNFDVVRMLDEYQLEPIASTIHEIISSYKLDTNQCRVATDDEFSVVLSGQIREKLGIPGPSADSLLPFVNKDANKKAIGQNGPVRLPRYVVFNPNEFRNDPEAYVQAVISKLGTKLFIKPLTGAGSENTWRLDDNDQLFDWCKNNELTDITFEIDERITGKLFNTTLIRVNGQYNHFFAMRHNRPNDEYAQGHKLGNIIVPPSDPTYHKLKTFSEVVMNQLQKYCAENGVFNIDFFLESGTDEPVLMEVAARAAGGAVGKVIEEYSGIGIYETSLLLQMGHTAPFRSREKMGVTRYAAYSMHPPKAGVVKKLKMPELDSDVSTISWRVAPGQRLKAGTGLREIALVVVITNPDLKSLTSDFDRINSEDYVIME